MNRKIHVISDTHNKHHDLQINPNGGDILIHCGDSTVKGNYTEGLDFLLWFVKQPYKYKVICYGNHAKKLKTHPDLIKLAKDMGIIVLHQDDDVRDIMGLRIWGGQFVPSFTKSGDPRHDPADQRKAWTNMPSNLDILVTHVPPNGILDFTLRNQNIGCTYLTEEVRLKKPSLHLFGHVHLHGQNSVQLKDTLHVNCANFNEDYELEFDKPLEFIL